MSEWQECNLGELISHKKGFAFKSSSYSDNGDVFIVRVSDTTDSSINLDSCKKISSKEASILSEYQLKKDDVIIATVGSWADNPNSIVGKVIKVPYKADGALLNQNAVRLRSNGSIDQKFIYYRLRDTEFSGYLLGNAQGSANQASITLNDIFSFKVSLPSPKEQKAIAAVLSSLDDKIDLLHRQNQTLEALAETLFRQWFLVEAQEDWEVVSIGDFVELNRASIDKNYKHKTIYYLDTGSLTNGIIEGFQTIVLVEAPSRAKRLVQHNDVLISTVRPDQKHYGIIKNPIKSLVVSTGFCVITCTKIDPHFIYLLLTNDEMTDFLHTIAEGSTSTYPSLKPSDIGSITFQLPPPDKLKEFSIFAEHSWGKIEKNHHQIRTLEKLRDTLLPKLMSGEARVISN